jgi:DNA-binding response OmpR family regulator
MTLFLLSFRYRDELAALSEAVGWQPLAARRSDHIERRFIASGADVAVVDARGALDDGLAAIRSLADAVEANGAALLVILTRRDAVLEQALAAGATHYLLAPFSDQEFAIAVRFAQRYVERLGGGERIAHDRAVLTADEQWGWRWQPGAHELTLSTALRRRLDLPHERLAVRQALALLDPAGRCAAMTALRRLAGDARTAAFAHGLDGRGGSGRYAQHLSRAAKDAMISGRIEEVGQPG